MKDLPGNNLENDGIGKDGLLKENGGKEEDGCDQKIKNNGTGKEAQNRPQLLKGVSKTPYSVLAYP